MSAFSLVINTCALGENTKNLKSSKGDGVPYGEREWIIEEAILPWAREDPHIDEIVIAGDYRKGEGYRYVESPSRDFNVWDQLLQKHDGWQRTKNDITIFLCDDHLPNPDFTNRLCEWEKNALWDVLSPRRTIDDRFLNVGWSDGYIHAHAIVARREPLHRCSFLNLWGQIRGTWALDVPMTKIWHSHGLRIQTAYDLICEDLEGNPHA